MYISCTATPLETGTTKKTKSPQVFNFQWRAKQNAKTKQVIRHSSENGQ